MRILLSAYACRPNAGSEPGVGWNWATHLADRGHEVHVLVANRNQQAIEAGLRQNPRRNLHFTYVPVAVGWVKKNEALHYALWQFAALKAARRLSRQVEFELAHHVTYASVHVPSQLWRLGIPVIFGPTGGGQTTPASMLKYFGIRKWQERLRSSMTRALVVSPVHQRWLQQMSLILAANNDTSKLVQALGCENTRLMCDTAIPAGYFAEKPRKFAADEGRLKLLWVGRMLKRKALPLALDAMRALRSDVTMTIAGDGIHPDAVHQMINERNLQSRIVWKGERLTKNELRRAYAEHHAMLFTSVRDSFGSQLLEAMAMALPVITLDLHGARDHVPAGASIKVKVGSARETVDNVARAIERYAALPAHEKDMMSAQARNFARTLSWPARVEIIEKLYEEVLARTRSADRASTSSLAAANA